MREVSVEIGEKPRPSSFEYEIPRIQEEVRNGDYGPRRMFLVTGYGCPYRCDHCFFFSGPKSKERMTDDTLYNSFLAAIDLGIEDVIITGGEPMLDPERVFEAVEYSRELDIIPMVQSSYMGSKKEDVRKNAKGLLEAGCKKVISSLSPYHRDSYPASEDFEDYIDYAAHFMHILTSEGLDLEYKLPWDLAGVNDAEQLMRKFLKKLEDITDVRLMTELYKRFGMLDRDDIEILQVNDRRITLMPAPIIMVGNARAKGLETEEWDESLLYGCPVRTQEDHEEGMLTVYPDGTAARCCSGEKNIDFGFGNVNTHSTDEIKENIENSVFLSKNISAILKLAHQVMAREFPHLLPASGPRQACETCSPLMSHRAVKDRVAELLGKPGIFKTPKPYASPY